MKFNSLLPLLSILGFLFASYTVVHSNQPQPVAKAATEPASAPFAAFIAGAGIIEPQSQNIAIGTPLPKIVKSVAVKVGEHVKIGQALFYLDDRDTRAELAIKQADLSRAQAELNVAKASMQDSYALSRMAEAVSDRRAISEEELSKRRNALNIAKSRVESARAQIQQAEANLNNTQVNLERLVIRAPAEAEVLQVNIRPGEFAPSGALSTPLMILGKLDLLHVRVDIDENDAWRYDRSKAAIAFLRGNREVKVNLKLAYVEPYVIPKKSLTGDSTERVDTRVLQALYSFERQQLPLYVGQQMDVFIETSPEGPRPSDPTSP